MQPDKQPEPEIRTSSMTQSARAKLKEAPNKISGTPQVDETDETRRTQAPTEITPPEQSAGEDKDEDARFEDRDEENVPKKKKKAAH